MSEESKSKVSKSLWGRKPSEETRAKLREAQRRRREREKQGEV